MLFLHFIEGMVMFAAIHMYTTVQSKYVIIFAKFWLVLWERGLKERSQISSKVAWTHK